MKFLRLAAVFAALIMLLSVAQPAVLAATSREEWSDWDVIKEATCSSTGERIRRSNMGNVQRETIPKKPHKRGPWIIVSEATCVQRAKEEHRCTVCGGGYEWQWTGELAPHTWGEWENIESEPGEPVLKQQRTCKVCGKTEEQTIDLPVLPVIAASGEPKVKVYAQVDPYYVKEFYTEGEPITLEVYLVNSGTIDLIYPRLDANNKHVISRVVPDPIHPGETYPEEDHGPGTPSIIIHDSGDGYDHIVVTASAEYNDDEGKRQKVYDEITLHLPVGPENAPKKAAVKLYAQIEPYDAKEVYTEDELVSLEVDLVNTGNIDLLYPSIQANSKAIAFQVTDTPLQPGAHFPGGESGPSKHSYTIHDSGDGFDHVVVSASARYKDADGNPQTVTDQITLNLPVAAKGNPAENVEDSPAEPEKGPSLTLSWSGAPTEEVKLGTSIPLKLTAHNDGSVPVNVYGIDIAPAGRSYKDLYAGWGKNVQNIAPGESPSIDYTLIVTPLDVESGAAERNITLSYRNLEEPFTYKSTNTVKINFPLTEAEKTSPAQPEEKESPYKLELVAVNQDAEGEPYLLNDVIHFKATATNRSSVPLDEIIIYDPYGLPAKHILNTVLPGEGISADIEYTVSEDDVYDGTFIVAIDAVGWAEDGGTVNEVWAPSVTFDLTAADKTEPDYHPLLVLSATNDPYGTLTAGSEIHTHFKVENAGDQAVVIDSLAVEPTPRAYLDIDTDFHWSVAGTSVQVDSFGVFNYQIVVTPEDIDYGSVVRDLHVNYIWTREDGKEFHYHTNNVHMEFPLDSSKIHPELTLSCGEITVGSTAPGALVSALMTLTNTGNVPVEYFGLKIAHYPGDDDPLSYENLALWDEHINEVLQPGDSFQAKHETGIVPPDLNFGFLSRNLRVLGTVMADEAELKAQGLSDGVWSNWEPIYVDFTDGKNSGQYATVVKSRIGDPDNGYCYQEGEKIHYHVEVTNISDVTLTGMALYDPIFRDAEVPLVSTRASLAPGEPWTVDFDYTVTAKDIEDYAILYNQAQFAFNDPEGGDDDLWILSNVEEAPLYMPHEEPFIGLFKHYDFNPANGSYYTPGEKVKFYVEVTNPNSFPLADLTIRDGLYWDDTMGQVLGYYPLVDPYFSDTLWFEYTIQDPDADQPAIYNTAYAEATGNGQKLENGSNTVEVPTGHPGPQERQTPFSISVLKEETSTPPHDGKYWINETIDYKITVRNTGSAPLFNITVKDTLKTTDGGVLGSIPFMEPDHTETYYFSHKVTKPDEDHGEVYNYAVVDYSIDPPMMDTATSDPVISKIGKKPIDDEREHPGPEDACVRTLVYRGPDRIEYTLGFCSEHLPILRQANALTAAAQTEEAKLAAYTEANALWTAAIDALYEELLEAYPQNVWAIIANHNAWTNMTISYGEALKRTGGLSEAESARRLSEVLTARTVDLCYALHNAGEAKLPESMITGKYHDVSTGSAKTVTRTQLTGTDGDLKLTVTLSPDLAVIEKPLRKDLLANETPQNQAAMLNTGARSYRTMIAGQLARAARSSNAESIRAFQDFQSAAYALLDKDAALWNALWPNSPAATAEIALREARELAVSFCMLASAR